MDVLLIGGTGLISTGITRQLVDEGHDVTCYTRGESEARVPEAVDFLHGDRTDFERFEEQMADVDADAVVDMVCFHPDEAESAVRAFGGETDHYVFCSTVDVYDRPPESNPVAENAQRHDDEHFVSEYGANKTACEDVFMDAHAEGAFEATVIRPWHTYGEGGTLNHTFGNDTYYVDRIERGLPIVVHGDGTSLWAPCHRDDVARAFVNAVGNEAAFGEAYNVTSDEHITWNQYHERVAEALDAPDPELVHVPTDLLREAAPDRTGMLENHFQFSTVFDNGKAKRDLGFEYTVTWREGVERTVAWLRERDRIEDAESEPFDDAVVAAWRDAADDFLESVDTSER
jgi:nucleoside-diphosphate-sugar epimerase